jgi:hypothetical protein
MTFQPLARKSWAVALPKPEEHPVIRTVLFTIYCSVEKALL